MQMELDLELELELELEPAGRFWGELVVEHYLEYKDEIDHS